MISPSKRRDFLDEIISKYDYEYENILVQFNRILRQRNAYLKKLAQNFYDRGVIAINDPQLSFWSNKLVLASIDIIVKRMDLCKKLSIGEYDIKYNSVFNIDGRRIGNIEYIKERIEDSIEKNKRRDIATGYSNVGPHRDDWDIFKDEDIKRFGSRGEKRLAIGKLIYQIQEIIYEHIGYYPILLLDDISSELDKENVLRIFDLEKIHKQQTFLTVVNKDILPPKLLKNAQLIHLNGSKTS
jgi:DNA replication and repair protein RecF